MAGHCEAKVYNAVTRFEWLCIFLLGMCVVAKIEATTQCPVSTCAEDDPRLPVIWMNTPYSATRIQGLAYDVYPMTKAGVAFTGAYMKYRIAALQELRAAEDAVAVNRCEYRNNNPSIPGNYTELLQQVDWNVLCCDSAQTTDLLQPPDPNEPAVLRHRTTITVTDPALANFSLVMELSTVNQSVSYRIPGTANTAFQDYFVKYSSNMTKMTISIYNWPWKGKHLPQAYTRPSYLKYFFLAQAMLEEDGLMQAWDSPLEVHFRAHSNRTRMGVDFLKVFTVDGIDYARSTEASEPDAPEVELPGQQIFPALFNAPFCQDTVVIMENPYWQNMTYDPSLFALFNGGIDEPSPSGTLTGKKKRLHPAAYVVPIVIVVLIIVVVAALVFSPFKLRHFRRLVLGRAAPKVHKLTSD